MCRLLIYNPGVMDSWRECLGPQLQKLGLVDREWEELVQGIRWDEASPLPLMPGDVLGQQGVQPVGTIPLALSEAAPEDAAALWQALRLVADYGRLALVRNDGYMQLYRYQSLATAGDYLYQPHPGRVVSGRYAEVFAPSNPDATICACAIADEVYWDADEQAAVLAFRREVLAALFSIVAQAEVTYIDSDGWYAEL